MDPLTIPLKEKRELIKTAQTKRLLEAGYTQQEADNIWKAYHGQYAQAWHEYVAEGLIPGVEATPARRLPAAPVEKGPRKRYREFICGECGRENRGIFDPKQRFCDACRKIARYRMSREWWRNHKNPHLAGGERD